MYVDIVIVNGKCMTMENDGTWDWIAVKDGKIFELGEGHDLSGAPVCLPDRPYTRSAHLPLPVCMPETAHELLLHQT